MPKFNVITSILILFVSTFAFAGPRFGLNDVSLLLPLPAEPSEMQLLLAPSTRGASEPVVSQALLERLPNLIIDDRDHAERRSQLRVVGIRFDPCFTEGDGPVPCRRQIRLVFQPISFFQNDPMTFDAAVHAFYDFSEQEWQVVMDAWKANLGGDSAQVADLPLQIHPIIKREGFNGPYWQRMRSLILRFCEASRVTRLTVSTVNSFGMQWVFQGFEVVPNGAGRDLQPIVIPRTNGKSGQIFVSSLDDVTEFRARILPDVSAEPAWTTLLRDSVRARQTLSQDAQLRAMERAFEFENPQRFNPGNVDCASCHISQTVRLWGERHLNGWQASPAVQAARFTSHWNLENTSVQPFLTNRVRAFGYFVDEPILSQRVINETAAVADLMARY